MWYVYVLLCSNNSLYTGASNNPQKRFLDHQAGRGGKYTKVYRPIKILYIEEHESMSAALKREAEIKSWSRAEKIQNLGLLF